MILFASDLDNTLIYSYKREIGIEKVCVEWYEGREVSFMTEKSRGLLREIRDQVCFVPTTTRSIEQYRRICFERDWEPRYALVCNGGVLLVENRVDEDWYRESLRLIEGCEGELEKAIGVLEKDENRSFEVRKVSDLFVFTKTRDVERSMRRLKEELDCERVNIFFNGVKIYVVPKGGEKGVAVRRLKERLGADIVITAGDSRFDVSMLEMGDVCFLPKELEGYGVQGKERIVVREGVFSDSLLEGVKERKGRDRDEK